jgi:hypothetical protein
MSVSDTAVGEVGRLLASAEMLMHGIAPTRPEADIGVDIVAVFGQRACRVQVKSVRYHKPSPRTNAHKFKVRRSRSGNVYLPGEVDAFVFVSIASKSFWVVPVGDVNLHAHRVTHHPGSRWHNAWHLLK